MTAERWQEIKPRLDRALDMGPEERRVYLDHECSGDPELRSELEEYLQFEEQTADLDVPIFDLVAGRPAEYRSGESVGRYVLDHQMARGGMGVVYLGHRTDGEYEQSVVVKILRKGFDTGEFVRWFRNERQILADLKHPNIARLLDGGTTEDGLPFLVMDPIEGRRLDEWVRDESPSVEEAVAVFLQICDAIHAAHQRLVVHCDLKPSNILVTKSGQPQVLDFGIAKILHHDAEGETRSLALRLGSPRYASPEQIAGQSISTAADVYSLGCVLFLLLTGRPPKSRPDEGTPPEVPSRQAPLGRRRRKRLRGDLDAIVTKARAWHSKDRYSSAGALADDVRRHLDDLPISAQPFTWRDLLRRFLRRNRQLVGVGAALSLVALVGLGASLGFYWQSELEASRAVGMRDAYLEMLEVYDPTADESRAEAARSAVEELLASERFRDDRDRAVIYDRMGQLFYRLEFLDEAETLHERALALRRQERTSSPDDLAASLNNLALVVRKQGDLERASELYGRALELHDQVESDDEHERLDILLNLAVVLEDLGRNEEAERLYRETLTKRRRIFGPRSMETARSLNSLGRLLYRAGKLDEAAPLLRESLEVREELLGPTHSSVITASVNFAALLDAKGSTDEAIEIYREVLRLRHDEFGASHPQTARARSALAYALMGRDRPGDLKAATTLLEDASAVYLERYGLENEIARIMQRNLAAALLAEGRAVEAETMLRQVIERAEDWRRNDSWRLADVRSLLGAALLEQGKAEAARPLLHEAWIPIAEQRGDESRPAREARERWRTFETAVGTAGG